ncbi:MAG TPA: glycosyltransferase family 87 protein [Phycisphaerae bacterium]|nr:glycosyltransferase family 87 protein [Phycisphaerae bacterium]
MPHTPTKKPWLTLPWQLPAAALTLLYLTLAALAARTFLHSKNGQYHGDFIHFYWAAQAMVNHQDLYTSGQNGYIYPPLLAFLFQPLAFLSERAADIAWLIANMILNAGSLLIAVHAITRRLNFPKNRTLFFSIALLAALLSLDKIRSDFALGQTDALMILSFSLILLWYDTPPRNPILLGLAVAFGACIKYLQLIFLPYFLFRRRYAAIATTLLGVAFFSLLPALTSGWNENLHNLRSAYAGMFNMAGIHSTTDTTTAPATAANIEGIKWERSISLTSAFSRLDDQFGAHKRLAALLILIFIIIFIFITHSLYREKKIPLFFRPNNHPASNPMLCAEWATLIILALILGPQTTSRHMVMLLPTHALAAALLLAPTQNLNKLPLLLTTILLFLSLLLPPGGPALDFWRNVAGASWCATLFALALLNTSLDYAARMNTVSTESTEITEKKT